MRKINKAHTTKNAFLYIICNFLPLNYVEENIIFCHILYLYLLHFFLTAWEAIFEVSLVTYDATRAHTTAFYVCTYFTFSLQLKIARG